MWSRFVPVSYTHLDVYKRQTGDSLGPLVGHMLRSRRLKGAAVIGTLDKPVHAMNLDLYARYIRLHYPDYVVVAIDASVGSLDHVGYATLGRGALQPGLGVSKMCIRDRYLGYMWCKNSL